MKKLLFCAALLASGSMFSQVGIGTDSPDPAAQLEVNSADKGVLVPRIALANETQQLSTSIPNANSMLIFNTAVGVGNGAGYYYWNATSGKWVSLFDTSKVGSADGQVLATTVDNTTGTPVTKMEWKSIGDLVSAGTVTGKTVSAGNGIEFTGTDAGVGAVLKEFGIKVKESALSLENIGGKLGITQIDTAGGAKGKILTVVEDNSTGTPTLKLEWKTVAEASQEGGGSALGSNVTAGSTKIVLAGTPAGAALKPFSIDVQESAIDIKNLGGVGADAGKVLTVVEDGSDKKMEWVSVSELIAGGNVNGGTATVPSNAVSGKDLTVGDGLKTTGTTVATGAVLKEFGLAVKAANGITVDATDGVKLGGTLTADAEIKTATAGALVIDGPANATNMKIKNLPAGAGTDEILVVSGDGAVKKVDASSVVSSGVINYTSTAQSTGKKWVLNLVTPAEVKEVVLEVDFGTTGATFVNIGSALSNGTTDPDLTGDDYKKVVVTNVRAIKKDSNSITQSATYDKSTGKLLMGVSGNGLVVTHKGAYYIVLEYYKGS